MFVVVVVATADKRDGGSRVVAAGRRHLDAGDALRRVVEDRNGRRAVSVAFDLDVRRADVGLSERLCGRRDRRDAASLGLGNREVQRRGDAFAYVKASAAGERDNLVRLVALAFEEHGSSRLRLEEASVEVHVERRICLRVITAVSGLDRTVVDRPALAEVYD